MGVSKNRGTPKSSILIGFSIIFTIHFGVPVFLETPIYLEMLNVQDSYLVILVGVFFQGSAVSKTTLERLGVFAVSKMTSS